MLECTKDGSKTAQYEHDPDVKKVYKRSSCMQSAQTVCCKHHIDTCCILIDAVVVASALLYPEPVVHGVQTSACLTHVRGLTELPKS